MIGDFCGGRDPNRPRRGRWRRFLRIVSRMGDLVNSGRPLHGAQPPGRDKVGVPKGGVKRDVFTAQHDTVLGETWPGVWPSNDANSLPAFQEWVWKLRPLRTMEIRTRDRILYIGISARPGDRG